MKGSYCRFKLFVFVLILVFEVGLRFKSTDAIFLALHIYVSKSHLVVVLVCLVGGLEVTGASGVDELKILRQSHAQVFFDFPLNIISLVPSFG